MSKAQDPFYIVKEEIQDSIDKLQSSFHQWERVPGGTGEQVHLTKELLANCESIAWQVDELDKAISVAARDPSWYGINEVELENRRRWTSNARLQKEHIFSNGVLPWWGKGKGSILVGLKQETETSCWREHEACGMWFRIRALLYRDVSVLAIGAQWFSSFANRAALCVFDNCAIASIFHNGCPLRIILFDKVADVKRPVGAGKENDISAIAIRRELMRLPNSQQLDISDHYSAKNNDDFVVSESDRQMLLLKQQDEELDELSTSVKRIGGVGLTIHEELLAQEKILDELGTEMDSTKNRLDFVQKKMAVVMKKAGAKGQIMIIIFLLVLFIILFILVFFT
ncbi:hypothetical protein CXB51_022540 [Gossypium anomalum]|uniref:t-SNARE coiled-coil homology domain-containing protein n=1 Tax=Gossypium anomalum TaxID=47600 RepID=A0A8J5Y716_9ROSI|nr:hypothetical protein CXB51_022540 [Gossypium anomalum]